MNFNKKRCLNNIYYLIKENGKKVGDLEKAAGVSAGYLSRLNKEDNNTVPSIEFLMSVAEELSVSVDVLVNSDMGELTATEKYILRFVKKLQKDTVDDDLAWKKIDMPDNELTDTREDAIDNPLYTYHEVFVSNGCDYPDRYDFLMYDSLFCNPSKLRYPLWHCYTLDMPGAAKLYLVHVVEDEKPEKLWEATAVPFNDKMGIELYLVRFGQVSPLCAGMDGETSLFATELKILHDEVVESSKHTKISNGAKESIEAFMQGLVIDEGLPFN